MPNYLEVISVCFPDAEVLIASGMDESIYSNIQWITTQIDQATLDASPCVVSPQPFSGSEVAFEDTFGQVLVEEFSKFATTKNAWLSHNGLPSNDNPSIIPFNGKLVGVAFGNESTDVSTDIEIYITPRNSTTRELAFTWEFRNGKKGFNNMVTQATFESGSKISIYLRNAGKAPKNVDVTVHLQVISAEPMIHIENE